MDTQDIVIEEIGSFTPSIGDAVRRLVHQLGDSSQPLSDQDIKDMVSAQNTYLFVARLADSPEQIVGMFTLIVYRIPYKRKAWIEDVVVDQDYRRQGIARKMITHAIEQAKKTDVTSLNLTSSSVREHANHLYQQLGFEKYETNVYRINL